MSRSRSDSILQCEECLPPADAFSAVADETRLSILEALWQLDTPARFSDVRAEVGLSDSAQFNYHLGRLTGQFVEKTGDGYALRTAGQRVVQAILAGPFTEHPRREFAVGDPCTNCGADLAAFYEDEMLTVVCPDCDRGHGRSDAEVLEAFDQRVRHLHCLAKDGVCPECNGRMLTTVKRGGDGCLGARLHADHVCQQCGHELCSGVGLALLDQSDVVAFCEEQGVYVSETPYWRFEWCVDDGPVTVRSEDPWRFEVRVTAGDAALTATVDEELTVVDTERA